MPVDFTPKDDVHGLAYKGLDPHQALFGTSGEHFNLFSGGPERPSNLLGDIGETKGRKLGISGQVIEFMFYKTWNQWQMRTPSLLWLLRDRHSWFTDCMKTLKWLYFPWGFSETCKAHLPDFHMYSLVSVTYVHSRVCVFPGANNFTAFPHPCEAEQKTTVTPLI